MTKFIATPWQLILCATIRPVRERGLRKRDEQAAMLNDRHGANTQQNSNRFRQFHVIVNIVVHYPYRYPEMLSSSASGMTTAGCWGVLHAGCALWLEPWSFFTFSGSSPSVDLCKFLVGSGTERWCRNMLCVLSSCSCVHRLCPILYIELCPDSKIVCS